MKIKTNGIYRFYLSNGIVAVITASNTQQARRLLYTAYNTHSGQVIKAQILDNDRFVTII